MKEVTQDKNGDFIYTEVADEMIELIPTDWHNSNKNIRVVLNLECLRSLNIKKEFNEPINQLYTYFKNNDLQKVEFNDSLYIYLDELYPEHRVLIEQNGGVIETKV
jgi:hypothetical protein